MKKLLIVVLLALLAGCGRGLEGTYSDQLGMARYTFADDGKVTVEVLGSSAQATYTRDKERVLLAVPDAAAPLEFTVQEDGSLLGPLGVRLEKAAP